MGSEADCGICGAGAVNIHAFNYFLCFFCRSMLNIFEVSQYDFILFSLIY